MKNRKILYLILLIISILTIGVLAGLPFEDKHADLSIIEPVFLEADLYTKSLGYNTICDTDNAFYRLKDEVL